MSNDTLTTGTPIDHEGTHEIVCPHCGYEAGDSWEKGGMGRDYDFEGTCDQCEKTYFVRRDVDVTYTTRKEESR